MPVEPPPIADDQVFFKICVCRHYDSEPREFNVGYDLSWDTVALSEFAERKDVRLVLVEMGNVLRIAENTYTLQPKIGSGASSIEALSAWALQSNGHSRRRPNRFSEFLDTVRSLSPVEAREYRDELEGRSSSKAAITAFIIELGEKLASLVAEDPRALDDIEWRHMEEMLYVVFRRHGFDVELTPPAQDGGKDLVLRCLHNESKHTYFVEIKHWPSKRVGLGKVYDFVEVTASEAVTGGLFLATYGFTDSVCRMTSLLERRSVAIGKVEKIVALCKSFVAIGAGIAFPVDQRIELLGVSEKTGC